MSAGAEAPFARQVPRPLAFTQEELDVRGGVEIDADAGERLLVGAEVEMLRVDEDPVVVEQDRVEH